MGSVFRFASALDTRVKWYGSDAKLPGQVCLRAGALAMIYENGNLRRLTNGNNEVIRMIYPAVRDKKWLTIKPEIKDEKIEFKENSFFIKYTGTFSSEDIRFEANFIIEGRTDNSVIFSLDGIALNTFEKNRIGFCVLHPVKDCAGISCIIEHTEGTEEKLNFPDSISPYQPFTDIKSMRWKINDSDYHLIFDGEIFETEDQRNWTDSSFKTYSTPLSLPYPVKVNKGTQICQKVELRSQLARMTTMLDEHFAEIIMSPAVLYKIPKIGIGKSTRKNNLTKNEIRILREIPFDHYRADLYLFDHDWKSVAINASEECRHLSYSLELALFFDENAHIQSDDFINWSRDEENLISLVHIFHRTEYSTPDWLVDLVAPKLRKALPSIMVSCGTNANFAQLNRSPVKSDNADLVSWSIHPQEHESDILNLIENIESQRDTVKSAVKFAGQKKIWISPVCIQRRFNANIENFERSTPGNTMPSQVDSRSMSLFGACWTLGSFRCLACSGVSGITYYETAGERGIIQGDHPSRWPKEFISTKGMIFPSWFIFRYILQNKSLSIMESKSSSQHKVDQLILTDGNVLRIIVVNYTSSNQDIKVPELLDLLTIKQLHSDNYSIAVSDKNWLESGNDNFKCPEDFINLEPFSISFIDGRIKTSLNL